VRGSWIYGIKIDGIDNSFPLKPLGRQEEWHAVRAFQASARTDWIRAKHAASGTAALKRWVAYGYRDGYVKEQKMGTRSRKEGIGYADEQIESGYFMDWVRDQLLEASRMDPNDVLPLETKADARVIARNMLKQLEWDTKRDLSQSRDFFKGFSERLRDSTVRDWLADEILEINRGMRGGGGVDEAAQGSPVDVLHTLQPGDMVTVESRELPRPRKLVVTNLSGGDVYVTSGHAPPGHVRGGRLHARGDTVFYSATIQQRDVRVSKLTRTATALAESRRGPAPVEAPDPDYVIQGLYTNGYSAYGDFGFDDEATAIAEAKKLAGSRGAPYFFEGDYVRVITRDGELVWDSRGGGGGGVREGAQSVGEADDIEDYNALQREWWAAAERVAPDELAVLHSALSEHSVGKGHDRRVRISRERLFRAMAARGMPFPQATQGTDARTGGSVSEATPSGYTHGGAPQLGAHEADHGCPSGSQAYMVRYVHKIAPRAEDVMGPVCINDNAFSNRNTLGAALRRAKVMTGGARVRDFRVEGEKTVVFPSLPGFTTYWHSIILTPA
jgi:hypothetical protein